MALIINKIKLIYITTNKFLRGTQISNDTDIYVIAYQSILSSSKFLFSQPVTWFKHSSFSSPCASRTCWQANGNGCEGGLGSPSQSCCETPLCGCCLCGGGCSSCGRSCCCCCCSCLGSSRKFNC